MSNLSELQRLPSLKATIKSFKLDAKKSLGQHFLTDSSLLNKIVRSAGNLEGMDVVEVGPGPGGLTREILSTKAKNIYLLEKDSRCIAALNQLKEIDNRIHIIEADALKVKIADITKAEKIKIISNLPYNISTKLLTNWYDEVELIASMTLMFQKEVAERIAARPKTKAYGRISVLSQWLCEVNKIFDIPPEAFIPPPKVTSTVVNIRPRNEPLYKCDKDTLKKLCMATFGQRRKTLRASMKQITKDAESILKSADIDSNSRPEELTIEQFCQLSSSLAASNVS